MSRIPCPAHRATRALSAMVPGWTVLAVVVLAVVVLAVALVAATAAAQQQSRSDGPQHARVVGATYINAAGIEADAGVGGVAVGPRGEIVFGGTVPGPDPEGARRTDLLGGGDGAIVRLERTGRRALSITRFDGRVRDLVVGDDGRIVAAVAGQGVLVLDREAERIIWRDEVSDARRVAVSASGRVVMLGDNREVRV